MMADRLMVDTKMTEKQVDEHHRKIWREAAERFGGHSNIPRDVELEMSEEVRAMYCIAGWDGVGTMRSLLAYHNVIPSVIDELVGEPAPEPMRRKDRYAKLVALSRDNLYGEFTTKDLTEASGLSASAISNWAKTTGHFRPRERGKWEARNPNDDRRNGRGNG